MPHTVTLQEMDPEDTYPSVLHGLGQVFAWGMRNEGSVGVGTESDVLAMCRTACLDIVRANDPASLNLLNA